MSDFGARVLTIRLSRSRECIGVPSHVEQRTGVLFDGVLDTLIGLWPLGRNSEVAMLRLANSWRIYHRVPAPMQESDV